MSARLAFERQFSLNGLRKVFDERIAHTAATGKDGTSPNAFAKIIDQELSQSLQKIRNRSYRFTSYRQKLVSKGAGKHPRVISVATVRDRVVLRAVNNVLIECFSGERQHPPHHLIYEIAHLIKPLDDEYSFVQIDVKEFYPSIVHDLLMKRLRARIRTPHLLDLIEAAIKTPTGDASSRSLLGVPQGLSISNILSAIYMVRFDALMHSRYPYFRYVDDIVVVCKTVVALKVFSVIAAELMKIGLQCHEIAHGSKSKIVPLSSGVDYLGYHLKPGVVSVRKSSYRRMMDAIMGVLTASKYSNNNKRVLIRLNLKITGCISDGKRFGWMFFFSMTTDVNQLRRLDRFVQRAWLHAGMEKYGRPKTFVKTYHEIRYRLNETKYIPRFDTYSLNEKAKLIADMRAISIFDVMSWPEDRIERTFAKIVLKEISQLENDVTPFS
jgi:RNA-directed DNA polymerase